MSSENSTLVKLNNAGFKQNDKWLVEGVSLTVKKGKIVTLIGPNGSGKSTTAKIALGIYKNIEGSVEKYTNKVGYVPQKISIDWTLPLRVYDFMLLTENIKDEAIDEALTLTGVIHLKNKNLGNLSGGEFQRVLIARAISKKPELLVLDEPVQGVDFTGEIALYELIKKISEKLNCGILLISHDLECQQVDNHIFYCDMYMKYKPLFFQNYLRHQVLLKLYPLFPQCLLIVLIVPNLTNHIAFFFL